LHPLINPFLLRFVPALDHHLVAFGHILALAGDIVLIFFIFPAELVQQQLLIKIARVVLDVGQQFRQQGIVPAGQLGGAVVGDRKAAAGCGIMLYSDHGQLRPAELFCRLKSGVARLDNPSFAVGDDRLELPELPQTGRNRPQVGLVVNAGVLGIGL